MKGLPVLSISCVLGTALASGERELRAISFKESVASGGNRPRKQYSNARERILLSQERIYRGGKGFLLAREEEPKMQHLRAGSQPSGEPIDVRLEKGRWGGCLRFLLSSLLLLTEIPHIYNDNMQTFLPAGE